MRYDPIATSEPDSAPAPRSTPQSTGSRGQRRVLRWILPLAVALVVGAVAGVAVAAAIHVPRVDTLEGFTPSLVTQLLARDGSVYATFARERRVMLKQGEIPLVMQQAVLASEDGNFFNHGGIDAMGVLRAAV